MLTLISPRAEKLVTSHLCVVFVSFSFGSPTRIPNAQPLDLVVCHRQLD